MRYTRALRSCLYGLSAGIIMGLVAGTCCQAAQDSAHFDCDSTVHFSRHAGPDSGTELRATFLVQGDPDEVYRTLRDAERFPEFMPGTSEVRVLEKHPDCQIVSFKGARGIFEAEVVLRRVSDDTRRRISWSLVRGSLKSSDGFWLVEPYSRCGAALVSYANTVEARPLVPARLIHSFLRGSIEDTAECLRRRVASGGVWQSDTYLKQAAKER